MRDEHNRAGKLDRASRVRVEPFGAWPQGRASRALHERKEKHVTRIPRRRTGARSGIDLHRVPRTGRGQRILDGRLG